MKSFYNALQSELDSQLQFIRLETEDKTKTAELFIKILLFVIQNLKNNHNKYFLHYKELITFHIARNTFAITVTLTNRVPIESVSKMLGHKNLRTTQHYAKILDRKVSGDMRILRDKFALSVSESKINLVK